jgi:hypothetical protein
MATKGEPQMQTGTVKNTSVVNVALTGQPVLSVEGQPTRAPTNLLIFKGEVQCAIINVREDDSDKTFTDTIRFVIPEAANLTFGQMFTAPYNSRPIIVPTGFGRSRTSFASIDVRDCAWQIVDPAHPTTPGIALLATITLDNSELTRLQYEWSTLVHL